MFYLLTQFQYHIAVIPLVFFVFMKEAVKRLFCLQIVAAEIKTTQLNGKR